MINIKELPNSGAVYKIISPEGRVYIGKTKNLKQRFTKYSNLLCEQQKKLYNSFFKHGFYNHTLEIILYSDDPDTLNENEIFYIKELWTFNSKNGLNLTKGGDGRTCNHTNIGKNNISNGLKNSEKFQKTMKSLDYKEKLSKSLIGHLGYGKGKKRSEEDIMKIKLGVRKHNEEFGSRKHTNESKMKMSSKQKLGGNNNSTKCILYFGNEEIEFECQKLIKNYLNELNEKLCLKGNKKYSYYGLIKNGVNKDIKIIKKT